MEKRESPVRRLASNDRIGDLYGDVKTYARQETVEPVRGAARWVAMGTLGALLLGCSVVYLCLGILRLAQAWGGTVLDGAWSFVPYLVAAVVLSGVVAYTFSRVSQRSLQKDQ